jgi:hypothetical protein
MPDDARYIEIEGRRWRRADPEIPESLESELVSELMSARRSVKAARHDGDETALAGARRRVHDAKLALGERGRPWWEQPDEESLRQRLAAAIRTLLRKRGPDKTICPSDAARVAGGKSWRDAMGPVRDVAGQLADDGWLVIEQNGEPVSLPDPGPIRLRMRS